MIIVTLIGLLASTLDPSSELSSPIRIQDGSKAIAVEIGHAAPFVIDFDGDGKDDLVVGQFGDGKARIYLNIGTQDEKSFRGFEWLQAGGEVAKVSPG